MSKYFQLKYQMLTPLVFLSISASYLNNDKAIVAQAVEQIENQAELYFGEDEKKVSNKPTVNLEHDDPERVRVKKRDEKIKNDKVAPNFSQISKVVIALENEPEIFSADFEGSILGEILYSLSGTVSYGHT